MFSNFVHIMFCCININNNHHKSKINNSQEATIHSIGKISHTQHVVSKKIRMKISYSFMLNKLI